jgi:hypothetical protein
VRRHGEKKKKTFPAPHAGNGSRSPGKAPLRRYPLTWVWKEEADNQRRERCKK